MDGKHINEYYHQKWDYHTYMFLTAYNSTSYEVSLPERISNQVSKF